MPSVVVFGATGFVGGTITYPYIPAVRVLALTFHVSPLCQGYQASPPRLVYNRLPPQLEARG
jgi:hypothetical protein